MTSGEYFVFFFQVRRKSKAYRRLREGDRIVSINGRSCEGLTYDQLMDIADKSETDLTIEVLRWAYQKNIVEMKCWWTMEWLLLKQQKLKKQQKWGGNVFDY